MYLFLNAVIYFKLKMAAVSLENWVSFFERAGIPPRAAATYALTFADNRIQLDMLLDLNKEYLRDMGITLMGDVIAILRHARQVHEELTHEKLLSSSRNPTNNIKPSINLKENSNNVPPLKAGKVSKVVKVSPKSTSSSSYSSSSSSQSSSTPSPPKKVSVSSRISDPKSRPSTSSGRVPGPSSASVSLTVPSTSEKPAVKRTEPQNESLKRKSAEISRPKPSDPKEALVEVPLPVKKARRVLPEHEGGYKIKMPTGSTPRTQQILAKQKESLNKKTVFDRLGGSSSPGTDACTGAVSSTTSDPTFAVTGLDGSKKSKGSSVFSRLGDKQDSSPPLAPVMKKTVPYVGILKSSTTKSPQRTPVVVQKTSSMVADSLTSPSRSDIQSRIGATKEVTVVKRSATVVSIPKQDHGIKRSASLVSVPRQVQVSDLKRTATLKTVTRPSKIVKTEGILAGYSAALNRPVKSRLGADETTKTIQAVNVRQFARASSSVKERVQFSRANGNLPSSPVKRVTFSGTQSNVFSRLGS